MSLRKLPEPRPTPLHLLPRSQLAAMLAAGDEVLECLRVLGKTGANLVGELLRGQGTFYEWTHYPDGDVYDHHSHAQYYYHAHRADTPEHGHFHTFLRSAGMPAGAAPVAHPGNDDWPVGEEALSHLVAIAMDPFGMPVRLFATNRWVTGEAWYPADQVIGMLDRFVIDQAWPSWPVNRWISAMVPLFRPEIEALVQHRDAVVAARAAARPDDDVLEDRELEITGSLDISIDQRIGELRAALGKV